MQYRYAGELFRWTTADVPPTQRFEYFAEALSSALAPMRVESDARPAVAATMTGVDLGPLTIVHQTGTAHRSYRGAADIARAGEHTYHLIVNTGAAWDIDHGRRLRLAPGDAVLADSNYGHLIEIRGDFELLHLKLSETWVSHWLGDPAEWVGMQISVASRWGSVLSNYVRTLSADFVLRSPPAAIGEHLGALLALVGGELSAGCGGDLSADATLHQQICDALAQRCGEVDLCAADVARPLALQARDIHRCLAQRGETFAAALHAVRIGVVQRIVRSPRFRRIALREIMARAGLPEATQVKKLSDPYAAERAKVSS